MFKNTSFKRPLGIKSIISKRIGQKYNPLEDPDVLLAYKFSNLAYQAKELRDLEFMGYNYIDDISGKRQAIYYNPELNRAFVAQRGTKPTDLKDLYQDAKILTGTFGSSSERALQGFDAIQKIQERYPNVEIINTGHSLGGSTANVIGTELNQRVIGFNRGSGLGELLRTDECYGENRPSYCDKITNYRVSGDPISLLSRFDKNSITINKPDVSLISKHSLGSFGI